MRIGILGGNFNPVHHAHLFIADQIQQLLALDEVQLMPENEPPHIDAKSTISAEHRVNMLLGLTRLSAVDIELVRN
jgi:nicotinate-nucleotide adenylyltransferase